MQLQAQELLDLRHAEAASLESDEEEESPEEPSPPALSSSSDEENEEEEAADGWSAETTHVNVPPFEAPTGKQHAARHADSPLSFLQLFLPPGLLQQWADYTNDYAQQRGAERDWQTTVEELYAFLGVHIYVGICPRTCPAKCNARFDALRIWSSYCPPERTGCFVSFFALHIRPNTPHLKRLRVLSRLK